MDVLYSRCAILDVHKDSVVARVRCVREMRADENAQLCYHHRTLIELQEWLSSHAVTHVAMEGTGVYWKPVLHLLDGALRVGAPICKTVAGGRSVIDLNDYRWRSQLPRAVSAPRCRLTGNSPQTRNMVEMQWHSQTKGEQQRTQTSTYTGAPVLDPNDERDVETELR